MKLYVDIIAVISVIYLLTLSFWCVIEGKAMLAVVVGLIVVIAIIGGVLFHRLMRERNV